MRSAISLSCLMGFLVVGCADATCDKNAQVGPIGAKGASCAGVALGEPLLGSAATCRGAVAQCSANERTLLQGALDCLDRLPSCAAGQEAGWSAQRDGCFEPLEALSAACRDAVFPSGVPDGGFDAGVPDAGRQPLTDGGGALAFVAVADESTFAFAWVPTQASTEVAKWELNVFDEDSSLADGGARLPELFFGPGNRRTAELTDAGNGVARRFFLAGVNEQLELVVGANDAGRSTDAGQAQCQLSAQCPPQQVCDLGQCKVQQCQNSSTCPPAYLCTNATTPSSCVRQAADGGFIFGTSDAGAAAPAPFLSAAVSVKTGPPSFHQRPVGGFVGVRPDMVAIDSARQFVALEQNGQPVGHYTVSRGSDFELDSTSASIIDTVGRRVRLAWSEENQVLFACYSVGTGVRLRRSLDYGKSWGNDALTLVPDDDGGAPSITDCDLAPWRSGQVVMVTVEDDALKVRTVADNLSQVGATETAFASAERDGGSSSFYSPARPAIATLPSDSMIHIGFTVARNLGASVDTEVVAVYRDGTTQGYTQPKFLNAAGTAQGNAFTQDHVAIAIDPKTKRGIAAYTANESAGGGLYNTVYVSIWLPASRVWTTGSDLTVFVTDTSNTTSYLFADKRQADLWDAYSPSVATMRDGRVWLSVVAGKRQGVNELHQYLVGFDFEKQSPVAGRGWFLPPAMQMSSTIAVDPRSGGNVAPASNSVIATDGQISVYGAFIEGVGTLNEIENRAIFVNRP